jgi:hypothetical protein
MWSRDNLSDTAVIFLFLNPLIFSAWLNPNLNSSIFSARLNPNLNSSIFSAWLNPNLNSFQPVERLQAFNPTHFASFPSPTTAKSTIAAPMPTPRKACGVPHEFGQMATLSGTTGDSVDLDATNTSKKKFIQYQLFNFCFQ